MEIEVFGINCRGSRKEDMDSSATHDTDCANQPIRATKAMPELTTKQLLEAERSHIFEVRVRQSEVIRQAGNIRFKQHSSYSSPSSSSSSFVAIAEAIELYQRALYHVKSHSTLSLPPTSLIIQQHYLPNDKQVDFEKSTYEFQLTEEHKAQIRAARIPIHLNLARCAMRQERYRDAINHAKSAVDESSGEINSESGDPAEMDLVVKANWIAGELIISCYIYAWSRDKMSHACSICIY